MNPVLPWENLGIISVFHSWIHWGSGNLVFAKKLEATGVLLDRGTDAGGPKA